MVVAISGASAFGAPDGPAGAEAIAASAGLVVDFSTGAGSAGAAGADGEAVSDGADLRRREKTSDIQVSNMNNVKTDISK